MADKVLTANHVLSGEWVFLAEGELWTPRISEALIAETAGEAGWLEAAGARAAGAQIVVEPCMINVARNSTGIEPMHICEKTSTRRPSERPHLGKGAKLEIWAA